MPLRNLKHKSKMQKNNNYISIAKILNFHGIKGEVKLGFSKGRENFISSVKTVYLLVDGEYRELHISSLRFHKQHAIVKFKEFDNINDVTQFKGLDLYVDETTVKDTLEDDEFLISDLYDLKVYDTDDCEIGVVEEVRDNPANYILMVKASNEKTYMVPFVKDLVPVVDIKNKKLVVNNIEGLID